jgi:NitT/TauT family transport system ATP-binding protein
VTSMNKAGTGKKTTSSASGSAGLLSTPDGESTARVLAENVSIKYVVKRAGQPYEVFSNLSLKIGEGELVCVVGPSGCGKSTLLAAIAGIVPISGGTLTVSGNPVTGPGRDRAVVFQHASLLPWRTALANVTFGLRIRGMERTEAKRRAAETLELVGLSQFHHSYPHEMSGGMQQRVNLARALAVNPEILLLDEPFASLDALQREILQNELTRIWEQTGKSGMFITHQIDEAVLLGDRVVVMSKGPNATILKEIWVDLPRPRNRATRSHPDFAKYTELIWELLQSQETK